MGNTCTKISTIHGRTRRALWRQQIANFVRKKFSRRRNIVIRPVVRVRSPTQDPSYPGKSASDISLSLDRASISSSSCSVEPIPELGSILDDGQAASSEGDWTKENHIKEKCLIEALETPVEKIKEEAEEKGEEDEASGNSDVEEILDDDSELEEFGIRESESLFEIIDLGADLGLEEDVSRNVQRPAAAKGPRKDPLARSTPSDERTTATIQSFFDEGELEVIELGEEISPQAERLPADGKDECCDASAIKNVVKPEALVPSSDVKMDPLNVNIRSRKAVRSDMTDTSSHQRERMDYFDISPMRRRNNNMNEDPLELRAESPEDIPPVAKQKLAPDKKEKRKRPKAAKGERQRPLTVNNRGSPEGLDMDCYLPGAVMTSLPKRPQDKSHGPEPPGDPPNRVRRPPRALKEAWAPLGS